MLSTGASLSRPGRPRSAAFSARAAVVHRKTHKGGAVPRWLHNIDACPADSSTVPAEATARRFAVLTGAVIAANVFVLHASAATELLNQEVDNASSPYIQELLKRTEENKDRRYKERLEDYYCRNFKDYFEVEVSGRGTPEMRGIQKKNADAMIKWLQDHPSCKVNSVR